MLELFLAKVFLGYGSVALAVNGIIFITWFGVGIRENDGYVFMEVAAAFWRLVVNATLLLLLVGVFF